MVASNETKPLLSLFPGRDLRASEKTRECDDLIYFPDPIATAEQTENHPVCL